MDYKKKTRDTLVVVDMQNDFITGTLANADAEAIVDPICKLIEQWPGYVIVTRDTHSRGYLGTSEGRHLPIVHCVRETAGWCVEDRIMRALDEKDHVIVDKFHFGYEWWKSEDLLSFFQGDICVVGTCTDVCVVSNVLIFKTLFPEADITVYEDLCAGTTPERHRAAIETMKSCQVGILTYGPVEKQG